MKRPRASLASRMRERAKANVGWSAEPAKHPNVHAWIIYNGLGDAVCFCTANDAETHAKSIVAAVNGTAKPGIEWEIQVNRHGHCLLTDAGDLVALVRRFNKDRNLRIAEKIRDALALEA